MNLERMKTLLAQVQQEKQAETDYVAYQQQQLQNKQVLNALKQLTLTGVGVGATIRGFHGLTGLLNDRGPTASTRVINLPVTAPKKEKEPIKQAAGMADLFLNTPGALPAALLGTPLSVYGGWKGVDMMLDKIRKKEQRSKLDQAKTQYEQALLGSYKQAVASNLDCLFTAVKQAEGESLPAWLANQAASAVYGMIPTTAKNSVKNLYGAYALGAIPLSYYLMDKHMKRNSPRTALNEAIQERARQRALTQPAQIYAYRADDEENQS